MKIVIEKKDIKKEFYKAGGPGGQNRNKVSSAVRLTHIPTGVQSQCSSTPCQHQNLRKAYRLLINKLARHYEELNRVDKNKENASFGRQKRTYRLCGQSRIDDHETLCYTGKVKDFLNGGDPLDEFLKEQIIKNYGKTNE